MPYTVSVQIVPNHWRVARVFKPVKFLDHAISPGTRLALNDLAVWVEVPLLPYVCASGVDGCAGWALVGERLVGFVRNGDLAEMVQHDLRARLDLLLVGLEQHGQAGLDHVREVERSDREQGQRLLEQMGLRALATVVHRV